MATFLERVTECEHQAYRILEAGILSTRLERERGVALLTCPGLPGPRFNHLALIRVPAADDAATVALARRKLAGTGISPPALALSPASFPPTLAALAPGAGMKPWLTESWLVFERDSLATLGPMSAGRPVSRASSRGHVRAGLGLLTGQAPAESAPQNDELESLLWLASLQDGAELAALIVAWKEDAVVYVGGQHAHTSAAYQGIARDVLHRQPDLARLTLVIPGPDIAAPQAVPPLPAGAWAFRRTIFAKQEGDGE